MMTAALRCACEATICRSRRAANISHLDRKAAARTRPAQVALGSAGLAPQYRPTRHNRGRYCRSAGRSQGQRLQTFLCLPAAPLRSVHPAAASCIWPAKDTDGSSSWDCLGLEDLTGRPCIRFSKKSLQTRTRFMIYRIDWEFVLLLISVASSWP